MTEISTPEVRVIVVDYNAGALLKRCLECLQRQTFRDFEAVIVDNGSEDGLINGALPGDPRFRLVTPGKNLGFAAGNNLGAEGCEARWIATLNPDAFAEPDWLENLIAATTRYPDVAMFGSTQIDANDENRLDGTGDAYFAAGFAWRGNHGHPISDLPPEGEAFSPCAAAALYRTEAFNKAGGFDERFFCYFEDVDLGFRIRLMGGRCVQVPGAVVRHVGAATSGRASDFAQYHSACNGIWLFVKNMPGLLFWLLLPAHLALQACQMVWAVIRGHAAPHGRGLAAGIVGLAEVLTKRREIQASRRASLGSIAGALTWSPFKLLRREHDVRIRQHASGQHP